MFATLGREEADKGKVNDEEETLLSTSFLES